MANLNFKWGVHSKLPKTLDAADVGALFFTKDEQSLYLGVEAGKAPKRIQGTVHYYADLTAFKSDVLPPYSSDVIYYIASENALVKWNGAKMGDGEEGRFVVLNVTAAEFDAKVAELATDISDNKTNIANNATNIEGLRTDLGEADNKGAAFSRIASLENAVAALEELTGTGSGDNSLSARIGVLENWMNNTAKGEISELQGDMSQAKSDISELQGDVSGLESAVEGHGTRLGTAEGKITALENADTQMATRVGNAETAIGENTVAIGTNASDISDLKTTTGGHTTAINGLTDRVGVAEGKVTDLESLTGEHTTKIGAAEGKITALETRAGNIEAAATELAGEVSDVKSTANGTAALVGTSGDDSTKTTAFGRIKKLEEADVVINEAASALRDRVKNVEDAIGSDAAAGTIKYRLATVETDLGTAKTDISDLKTTVATKAEAADLNTLAGRVTDVETKNGTQDTAIQQNASDIIAINNKIGTVTGTVADAIATVAGDLSNTKSTVSQHSTDISDLKTLTGSHTTDINTLNGEISNIKTKDGEQDGKISAAEGKISALEGAMSTAQGEISELKTATGANAEKFDDYYTKTEADNLHTALSSKIDSEINAANALKYKGGVANDTAWDAIKNVNTEIGATYIVTNSNIFLDINGTEVDCYAGDLLIATAKQGQTENAEGVLAGADVEWVHVKAGYQQELESELRVIDGDTDANKKATVQLTSYPAKKAQNYGDLGAISVVANSENLEVVVEGSNINIGLVWGSFGE